MANLWKNLNCLFLWVPHLWIDWWLKTFQMIMKGCQRIIGSFQAKQFQRLASRKRTIMIFPITRIEDESWTLKSRSWRILNTALLMSLSPLPCIVDLSDANLVLCAVPCILFCTSGEPPVDIWFTFGRDPPYLRQKHHNNVVDFPISITFTIIFRIWT